MKLDKELKEKIDGYFDNISASELYTLLKEKYNFPEDDKNVVITNDEYISKADKMIYDFINDNMSYSDIFVKEALNVVKMKFIENTSDSESDNTVYNQSCSIPLAA